MKFRPCLELKDPIHEKPVTMDQKGEIQAHLGDLAIQALLAERPGETIPPEKKMHRFNLASRIKHAVVEKAHEIDLPVEDISLIKECLGKVYSPLIMGIAWRAIESA